MANSKAAKKYILVTKRNNDRNKHLKTHMKTSLKIAYQSIENFSDDVEKIVQTTCRILDKVTTKGILKKNSAARKKSRLVKAFNSATAEKSKKK